MLPLLLWLAVHCILVCVTEASQRQDLVGYPVAGTNRDSADVSHDKAEGDKDGYTYSYYGVAAGTDGNHSTTGSGRGSRSKSLDGWLECGDGSEPQLPGGEGVQYWHYESESYHNYAYYSHGMSGNGSEPQVPGGEGVQHWHYAPESYHNYAYYSHGMSGNGMLYNTSRPSGLQGAVLNMTMRHDYYNTTMGHYSSNTTMGHYSFYGNGSRFNHSVDRGYSSSGHTTMGHDYYNHGRGRGLNTTMGDYSLHGNGSRSGFNGSVFRSTWHPDEGLDRDMYNEYHGLHYGNTSRHGWNGSIMNWSRHSKWNVSSYYRSYHDNRFPTCSDGSRAQMMYVAAVKVTNQTVSRKRAKRERPIRLAIALVLAGFGVALVCSLGFAVWACRLRGKVRCLESKLCRQTSQVIGVPVDVEQPSQTLSNISKPPIYV